jgi:hypothetical protein
MELVVLRVRGNRIRCPKAKKPRARGSLLCSGLKQLGKWEGLEHLRWLLAGMMRHLGASAVPDAPPSNKVIMYEGEILLRLVVVWFCVITDRWQIYSHSLVSTSRLME